jgi:hypothetical protein
MAKYLCVKNFVMKEGGEVAFKAGEVYQFTVYDKETLVLVQSCLDRPHFMPYKDMSNYFHKIIK